jgi:glucose 1-dehydrogenase
MSLEGKVAVVTGASSGIGKSIALELGHQGAYVAVNYHSHPEPAQEVVAEIQRSGSKAVAIQANVGLAADVKRMFDQTVNELGPLRILVNNAGIEEEAPFIEITEEAWDRVIAVDLKGPFLCAQAAAREMVRTKSGGTIINISSVHEDLPFPGFTPYCAAKGALRMMCRNMAPELAPYGINVVNVAPGAIATPINRATLESAEKTAALEHAIPLQRIGTPEEIAKLVAYLSTEDASYITGTTIFIDGGLMLSTGAL